MSRDKQTEIEEMANIIALKAFEQAHLIDGDENLADIVATDLYEKGYRKAFNVAEEIFAEIEKLTRRYHTDEWYLVAHMEYDLAELKKIHGG